MICRIVQIVVRCRFVRLVRHLRETRDDTLAGGKPRLAQRPRRISTLLPFHYRATHDLLDN